MWVYISDDALWENKNQGDSEDAISCWIQMCVQSLVPLCCSVSPCPSHPHPPLFPRSGCLLCSRHTLLILPSRLPPLSASRETHECFLSVLSLVIYSDRCPTQRNF